MYKSIEFYVRIPRHAPELNNQLHDVVAFSLFLFFFSFLFSISLFPSLFRSIPSYSFVSLFVAGMISSFLLFLHCFYLLIYLSIYLDCRPYNVLGIATRLELDGSGIESRCR
jgi:hypothetical protein